MAQIQNQSQELGDELLDDLLAGTQEEADLASEDDQPTEAVSKDKGIIGLDLDELLAESLAQRDRQKQHKADLRTLRSRTNVLDAAERQRTMARVLEWEVTHVWATLCKIERYDVYTCEQCLRQQTVFAGEWLEQEHKKLKCKRLVRVPSIHDLAALSDMMHFKLAELPVQRMNVPVTVARCPNCTKAQAQSDYQPQIKF